MLQLFADYHQFYLQDEAAAGDLSDAWSPEAVERMLAVAEGVVGCGTVRDMHVPVTLELLDVEPSVELDRFDHVVDGSLTIVRGPLVMAGCTDAFADAARFDIAPGSYRIRLSAGGFDTLSEDGLEGEDHYRVQVWPGAAVAPVVLKQGAY